VTVFQGSSRRPIWYSDRRYILLWSGHICSCRNRGHPICICTQTHLVSILILDMLNSIAKMYLHVGYLNHASGVKKSLS